MARVTVKQQQRRIRIYLVALLGLFVVLFACFVLLKRVQSTKHGSGSNGSSVVREPLGGRRVSDYTISDSLNRSVRFFRRQPGISIIDFGGETGAPYLKVELSDKMSSRQFVAHLRRFLNKENGVLVKWWLVKNALLPVRVRIDIRGSVVEVSAGWRVPRSAIPLIGRHSQSSAARILPIRRKGPKIAIVLDDAGDNNELQWVFLKLPGRITFAVMPLLKYSTLFARRAQRAGYNIILHAPMQPRNVAKKYGVGGGMLTLGMSEKEVFHLLDRFFASVPGVRGANNHMGSLATANLSLMSKVMRYMKQRRRYFLDSVTHHTSVAYSRARVFGVPALKRDIFLDHRHSYSYIRSKLFELARLARQQGQAIGIGHVTSPMTYRVLREYIPKLKRQGFRFVFISELIK